MKKRWRRFTSIFLAFCMVAVLLPWDTMIVHGVTSSQPIWLTTSPSGAFKDITQNSNTTLDKDGWTWNANTKTLTLKNYHYKGSDRCIALLWGNSIPNKDVTLVLIGENSITITNKSMSTCIDVMLTNSQGVFGGTFHVKGQDGGALTISGGADLRGSGISVGYGALSLETGATIKTQLNNGSGSANISSDYMIYLNGAKVEIEELTSDSASIIGIRATGLHVTSGELRIRLKGGTGVYLYAWRPGSTDCLTMSGGVIDVQTEDRCAVDTSQSNININGGALRAVSKGSELPGIRCGYGSVFTFNGGTVTAGGSAAKGAITFPTKEDFKTAAGKSLAVINGTEGTIGSTWGYNVKDPAVNDGCVTLMYGYNVGFHANGGAGTMESQTYNPGDTGTLSTNTFTREGYTFTGWNTQADGEGTSYADEQAVTPSGALDLYAQWKADEQTLKVTRDSYLSGTVVTADGKEITNDSGEYTIATDTEVTLEAMPEDNFFLWQYLKTDNSTPAAITPTATDGTKVTFKMPPYNLTAQARGIGGVMAMGDAETNRSILMDPCTVTATLTGNTEDRIVTLRDGDAAFTLDQESEIKYSKELPQNGRTYQVWIDDYNTGQRVTLTGAAKSIGVTYATYKAVPRLDGVTYASFNKVVTLRQGSNAYKNGANLPTGGGYLDVYVDGLDTGVDCTGSNTALPYFTVTYKDNNVAYGEHTPFRQQIVLGGETVSEPQERPFKDQENNFRAWKKGSVDFDFTTSVSAATVLTADWIVKADCEARWVIEGDVFYGTLQEGLDATNTAKGGDVYLQKNAPVYDATLRSNATLDIPEGLIVTVQNGKTFQAQGQTTNKGTIAAGSGTFTNSGLITNKGTIRKVTNSGTIDGGTITGAANSGTVKNAIAGISSSTGTIMDCRITEGTGIAGILKGQVYAEDRVTFTGANAKTASVNIEGGAAGFSGLAHEESNKTKLNTNVVVRSTVKREGTLNLNGHILLGADGADKESGSGAGTNGVTPITVPSGKPLTVTSGGSIRGGYGGTSKDGNGGSGGHGMDASANGSVTIGKGVEIRGGNGGGGTGSGNTGGNGGCGVHAKTHGSSAPSTGSVLIEGSAVGGKGGPALNQAAGGSGGYAVCADKIYDGGGSLTGGGAGETRPSDPLDQDTNGGSAGTAGDDKTTAGYSYLMVYSLTKLEHTGSADAVKNYQSVIAPKNQNQYIALPKSIQVKMGGNTLSLGTDYSYDSADGTFVLLVEPTATVSLTAAGVVPPVVTVDTADQLTDAFEAEVPKIIVVADITVSGAFERDTQDKLFVNEDKTLTLSSGTLTNKGIIVVNGAMSGTVENQGQGIVLDKPQPTMSYEANKPNRMKNLKPGADYLVEGESCTADDYGTLVLKESWFDKEIRICQIGRGEQGPNAVVDLTDTKRADAPASAEFVVTQPTAKEGAGSTGAVKFAEGKYGTYEYSTDGGKSWLAFTTTGADKLPQGTVVLLRTPSDGTKPAGKLLTFTIITIGGGGSHNGGNNSKPPVQNGDKVPVIVDGQEHNIGNVSIKDDHTTVNVNQSQLNKQLESASKSVVVPVSTTTDKVTAQLVVQNVADMQKKDMTLTVQTDSVSYIIPSRAVDIDKIKAVLGQEANLGNAPLNVTLAKTDNDTVQKAEAAAKEQGFGMVGEPMDFTITASYNGKTTQVTEFKSYVAREIEVTAQQAKKITTAVVYEPDGSVRHVPTFVYERGGKYFAKINSLTNSTYVLIYNEEKLTDVQGKWYEAVVGEMASRKVISGVGNGKYEGDRAITRGEFAAIVVRALGLPADGKAGFSDVSKDAWYSGAVAAAAKFEIVTGVGNNKFEPKRTITRQEAMAMIYTASRVTGYTDNGTDSTERFNDYGTQSKWATEAVDFNLNNGFIVGAGGKFRPKDNIVRSEVAAVVLRLLQRSDLVDVRNKA